MGNLRLDTSPVSAGPTQQQCWCTPSTFALCHGTRNIFISMAMMAVCLPGSLRLVLMKATSGD